MSNSEEIQPEPAPGKKRRRRGPIRPTAVRRLKWRVEALGYVLFELVLGCLPLTWVARLGRAAGFAAYKTLSRRRRAVLRNLRIAFGGERPDGELRDMTAEVFKRSGANLLCALRTARLGDKALGHIVTLRDEHVMKEALAGGRGVVVLLAHMGNWEALAQWMPRFVPAESKGATIYRPLNNPILNARVEAARRRRGLELFSKRDNPLGMAAFLRRGGALAVLADQRAGAVGELVPFFGRWTSCTPIPAILARRTGAATVGVSLKTVGVGRWELRFHALHAGEPTTANMMALVEQMIRVSPEDVFWLQERWRTNSARPHVEAGKPARAGSAAATKRRRALIWAVRDGAIPALPPAAPEDVDYELALPAGGAEPAGLFTRIHRAGGEPAEVFLDGIDRGAALPLDFVVHCETGPEVARACERLGIGVVEVAR